jgi:hypothetical protein
MQYSYGNIGVTMKPETLKVGVYRTSACKKVQKAWMPCKFKWTSQQISTINKQQEFNLMQRTGKSSERNWNFALTHCMKISTLKHL